MARQSGSILIIVIGMTTMLTVAAGSLLFVAANARNDEDFLIRKVGCQYDAESGLMLGTAWLRKKGGDFIKQPHEDWPEKKHSFPQLTLDNGSQVTVTIVDNTIDDPADNTKTVVSRAEMAGVGPIECSAIVRVSKNTNPPELTLIDWRIRP